jgi:hypothetical protein
VVITREALNATSAAELFSWTVDLEKQGCVPLNSGLRLAERIVDALPLDLAKRVQLLQGRRYLRSVNSLRVVSTIYKAGASADAGVITGITQKEGSYNLSVDWPTAIQARGTKLTGTTSCPASTGSVIASLPEARRFT